MDENPIVCTPHKTKKKKEHMILKWMDQSGYSEMEVEHICQPKMQICKDAIVFWQPCNH